MDPILKEDVLRLKACAVKATRLISQKQFYTVANKERILKAERELAKLIKELEAQ